jgi:membrane protein
MTEPAKPGILDRFRARYKWFDHVMRAQERYQDSKGDFYAAGITYFTIFALFPLLMVAFSIAGFVLANQPDLIGLATAAWAGLGWMANLREALSQMWGLQRQEGPGFLRTKLSDLIAIFGLFAAIIVTVALTALGSSGLMKQVVKWLGLQDLPGMSLVLRLASLLVALLISWLLFAWIIARLPREKISFRRAARAGLMAAVAFEIFKQVGTFYLKAVVSGPAGATFGPVLGLMVFAYITARLILFATAWAATSTEILEAAPIEPPAGAVINPRVQVREGLGPAGVLTATAMGAIGALGFSRLSRRR